jgi:hypothetical protein
MVKNRVPATPPSNGLLGRLLAGTGARGTGIRALLKLPASIKGCPHVWSDGPTLVIGSTMVFD